MLRTLARPFAALVLALVLSGCSTLGEVGQSFGQAAVNIAANAAGPSSANAVNAVAVIELSYTAAARAAVIAMDHDLVSPSVAHTLRELNDAIDVRGEDGQQHGLLVTARDAAQRGDNVLIPTTYQALVMGMKAFTDYETANHIGVAK